MEKESQYIPTSEEIKEAEEMMSPEEKKMSEEREAAYEAGKSAEHKESLEKDEVFTKAEALITGIDNAIEKFRAIEFIGDMHPSSNTVGSDVKRFFDNDIQKRKEIFAEVKKIQEETNAFFKSSDLGYVSLHDLDRYLKCIEYHINETKETVGRFKTPSRNALNSGADEYGLRFKTNLAALRDVATALKSRQKNKK